MQKLILGLAILFPVLLFGQANPTYTSFVGSNNIAITVSGTGNAKKIFIDDHILFHPPTTNGASGDVLGFDPSTTNAFWTPQTVGLVTNSLTIVTNLTVINNLNVSNEYVTNIIVQTEIVTNITVINNTVVSNLFLTNGTIYATNSTVYINGVSNLANINPTDNYIPYRTNSTSFGDSPLYRINATSVGLTNSSGATATLIVAGTNTAGFATLKSVAGGIELNSAGTTTLRTVAGNGLGLVSGSFSMTLLDDVFYPNGSNIVTGGQITTPFKDWFSKKFTLMGTDSTTNVLTALGGNTLYLNGIPIGGSGFINPTANYLPYNKGGTNFGDSSFVTPSFGTMVMTNTNSAIATFIIAGTNALGKITEATTTAGGTITSAGGLGLASASGSSFSISEGANRINFLSAFFYPNASNAITGGQSSLPFKDWFSKIYTLIGSNGSTNQYTDNGTNLLRNGVAVGGASQTPWLSDINGSGFQLTNVSLVGLGLGSYLFSDGASLSELQLNSSTNGSFIDIAGWDANRASGQGSYLNIQDAEMGPLVTLTPYATPVSDSAYLYDTFNAITNAHTTWEVQGTNIASLNADGSMSLSSTTNRIADSGSGITWNGTPIGGGSQTPWLSDINAAGFYLTNIFGIGIQHATNSSGSGAFGTNIGLAIGNFDQATNSQAIAQRAGLAVGWMYTSDASHILAQDAIAVGSFEGATSSQIESYDGSYAGGQLDVANTTTVSSFNGGLASGNYIASVGATAIASAGLAMGYGFGATTPMVEAFNGSIAAGIVGSSEIMWATNGSLSIGRDVAGYSPSMWTFGEHYTNATPSLAVGYNGVTAFRANASGITTGVPTGGSVSTNKFGAKEIALTITANTTNAVRVEINGTKYWLMIANETPP